MSSWTLLRGRSLVWNPATTSRTCSWEAYPQPHGDAEVEGVATGRVAAAGACVPQAVGAGAQVEGSGPLAEAVDALVGRQQGPGGPAPFVPAGRKGVAQHGAGRRLEGEGA